MYLLDREKELIKAIITSCKHDYNKLCVIWRARRGCHHLFTCVLSSEVFEARF